MKILGFSAFYHDSAACLLVDGRIVAAAQEERFTRRKHDAGFPVHAMRWCLAEAGIDPARVDHVVYYEKPFLKFERLLDTYLAYAPRGFTSFAAALPVWLKEKLFLKRLILDELKVNLGHATDWRSRLLFTEHHLGHAASAFYPSPFSEALVLTLDGVGEWTTTSLALGRGHELEILREIHFPHSLGLLYAAFTYYTGFKVNSGEYKVMGLAPYGRPVYADLIKRHLIDIKPDGSFRLDLRYFNYCTGLTMTSEAFHGLFGGAPRKPEEPLQQRHMDLAASIQSVTEDVVCLLAEAAAKATGQTRLCLAGGVALNCVANGRLRRLGLFEDIWVQPAAGDAGGALGAALAVHHLMLGHPRTIAPEDDMQGALLGPKFSQTEIESRLTAAGANYEVLSDSDLIDACANALAGGATLGWHQGRMEFGPRALGARSILADPRSPEMQRTLNLQVKFRESFRPFAPSVLREDVADWFEFDGDSPYMLMVAGVKPERRLPVAEEEQQLFGIDRLNVPRSTIPAVTHVDYSARLQTVNREANPRYHALLSRFKALTGCPMLVNTSFNVRGEPLVHTPEDAFRCFMGTEIKALAVGNCFLWKDRQPAHLRQSYQDQFAPD